MTAPRQKLREWTLHKELVPTGDDGLHYETYQIAEGEWIVGNDEPVRVREVSTEYDKAVEGLVEALKAITEVEITWFTLGPNQNPQEARNELQHELQRRIAREALAAYEKVRGV